MKFTSEQDCGHLAHWGKEAHAPYVGEMVWCFRCENDVRVTKLVGPWMVRCLRCNRVTKSAVHKETVLRIAIEHIQKSRASHRVRVWQYGNPSTVTVLSLDTVGTQPALDLPFI